MITTRKSLYYYKGITLQGQTIKGALFATDKISARQLLNHRGITILTLHKK